MSELWHLLLFATVAGALFIGAYFLWRKKKRETDRDA